MDLPPEKITDMYHAFRLWACERFGQKGFQHSREDKLRALRTGEAGLADIPMIWSDIENRLMPLRPELRTGTIRLGLLKDILRSSAREIHRPIDAEFNALVFAHLNQKGLGEEAPTAQQEVDAVSAVIRGLEYRPGSALDERARAPLPAPIYFASQGPPPGYFPYPPVATGVGYLPLQHIPTTAYRPDPQSPAPAYPYATPVPTMLPAARPDQKSPSTGGEDSSRRRRSGGHRADAFSHSASAEPDFEPEWVPESQALEDFVLAHVGMVDVGSTAALPPPAAAVLCTFCGGPFDHSP